MADEEWRVGRNIHEIIAALPEFIDQIKHQEDQALEQREVREAQNLLASSGENASEEILSEVFGTYHLGETYDLSHFTDTVANDTVKGKHTKTCKIFACMEQDEMDGSKPDGVYY